MGRPRQLYKMVSLGISSMKKESLDKEGGFVGMDIDGSRNLHDGISVGYGCASSSLGSMEQLHLARSRGVMLYK